MNKMSMSPEFFAEFKKNPKMMMEKFGMDKNEFKEFYSKDFSKMSYDEFQKMVRKSKMMGFFDMF